MEVELRNNSQEIYKAKAFIQRNYIVFEIKSDSENYSNQFTLEQLSNLNRYFKQAENLEDAINLLKDLFEENYSIEKQEEAIELTIIYKKRKIEFILDIVKEEENILYDSLVFCH